MTPQHTMKDWEKEFDDNFVAVKKYYGKDKPPLLRNIFADEINLPNKVKAFIKNTHSHLIQSLIEKVEGKKELHKHNSIPSYTADLEEGCSICIKNNEIEYFIKLLKESV